MAFSAEEVKNNLVNQILTNFPTAEVQTGSVIRDIFVDPQSIQIANLSEEIDRIGYLNTFVTNAENISEEDMNELGANYGVTRKLGDLATGTITFRTNTRPTENIRIGNEDGTGGINVKTLTTENGNTYEFVTTETVYMNTNTSYNEKHGYYEVSAPIQATSTGTAYNIGVGTITVLPSAISGITGCYNYLPTTGGTDIEGNADYALRIQGTILGSSKNIEEGINNVLLNIEGVQEVKTLHPNSKEEPTETGYAISYIRGTNQQTTQDTFTYITNKLTYRLKNNPVIEVLSVTINGVNVDFNFIKDTKTTSKNTIYANDYLEIIESPDNITAGSTIIVNYTYNKLIGDCQNELNENLNNYLILGNILSAQAQNVIIDINTNIKLKYSYNNETYKNIILTGIANFINSLKLGQEFSQEELFTFLTTTYNEYITTVSYPFLTFKKRSALENVTTLEFNYGEYASLDSDSLSITFE